MDHEIVGELICLSVKLRKVIAGLNEKVETVPEQAILETIKARLDKVIDIAVHK